MEPRGSRCKFFLAFLLRHAHTHMQINTGPRPPSGSVDTSADLDILPQPVSLLSIRKKKKKKEPSLYDLASLCICLSVSHFSSVTVEILLVCLFEERTNECKCEIARNIKKRIQSGREPPKNVLFCTLFGCSDVGNVQ